MLLIGIYLDLYLTTIPIIISIIVAYRFMPLIIKFKLLSVFSFSLLNLSDSELNQVLDYNETYNESRSS